MPGGVTIGVCRIISKVSCVWPHGVGHNRCKGATHTAKCQLINQSINQHTETIRNIWISYVDAMWRLESSSTYLLWKCPIFKRQQYTHSTLCIGCLWCLSAYGPTSHCGQIGPTNPLKIKDANFPSTTVLGYLDVFGSTTLHFFTSPCR